MDESMNIQQAADLLWDCLNQGKTCAPVRELIGTDDLGAAYAVQDINTQRKRARGESIVGVKIGLTSEAVQRQLGVDQPDYGVLTDAMHVSQELPVQWSELIQPKAEMEVGFILGKDLPSGQITMDVLKDAISAAVSSIEIVGSRVEKWDIRITDTIADNASASHFVIGDAVTDWSSLDLVNCKMEMMRAGEVVSQGCGSACMGNPLNAALWLAQTMAKLGTPLKKDYIILAGALGPMVPVNPGDSFTGNIEGLGSVSVSFGTTE